MHTLNRFSRSMKGHFHADLLGKIFKIKELTSFAECRTIVAPCEGFQESRGNRSYENVPSDVFGKMKHSLEKIKEKQGNLAELNNKVVYEKTRQQKPVDFKHDVFGKETLEWDISDDECSGDINVDSTLVIPLDLKSPKKYLMEMKELIRAQKLKEALELFEYMKAHRVTLMHVHFTFLIGACGRVGYTEMAFNLFKEMTSRHFVPTPATLTGLFNSCSECPFPEYGLERALHLREKIKMRLWQVAVPTYHAMIKAFGRCGDMESAFEVFEEMIESGEMITATTFNFLLTTCITNKEAGFTYAIEVWRKMISKKVTPNKFSYNLLLRSIRDCGVGNEEVSCNLLQHWVSHNKQITLFHQSNPSENYMQLLCDGKNENMKLLVGSTDNQNKITLSGDIMESTSPSRAKKCDSKKTLVDVKETQTSPIENCFHKQGEVILNILNSRLVDGPKIMELRDIKKPMDKLQLVGGVEGFLQMMVKDNITPSIKTFTMLLRVISGNLQNEHELLCFMDEYKVLPDIDFFNMLIKKRCFRKDFIGAKDVLLKIREKNLHPDIVTYGVLALGCRKKSDGLQLLNDLRDSKILPNVEIMGALLNCACKGGDYRYIMHLLKKMKVLVIKPNEQILSMLNNFKDETRKNFLPMVPGDASAVLTSEKFFRKYCTYYEKWLKTVDVELTVHPWTQYRTLKNEKDADSNNSVLKIK